ncbi:hypothetical protein T484DRAFT_1765694 [Baffinella frigidus]|nr:hypothetical protein T484DRAFT_1765694 [Cryptophyta sp. CCMP2293]
MRAHLHRWRTWREQAPLLLPALALSALLRRRVAPASHPQAPISRCAAPLLLPALALSALLRRRVAPSNPEARPKPYQDHTGEAN